MTRPPADLHTHRLYAHRRPGWLVRLGDSLSLDAEDEAYLTALDDWWIAAGRELAHEHARASTATSWALRGEIMAASPRWVLERRRDFLAGVEQSLRDEIAAEYAEYASYSSHAHEVGRLLRLGRIDALERRLSKVKGELRSLSSRRAERGISDAEIERARARQIDEILAEQPHHGKIVCPVHAERTGHADTHPSMMVKRGFAHCFSCGATLDAIGYLMKVRGLSFPDAVRALQ